MTLKSIVMSSACCLGVLALSPVANAGGLDGRPETTTTLIGAAPAAQTPDVRQASAPATQTDKSVVPTGSRAPSPEIAFVAKSSAAHTAVTGHGKPAEAPSSSSKGGGSAAASNPIAGKLSMKAAEMAVVADAKKAKASLNAGGKPSEQIGSTSGAGGGSGSSASGQTPVAAQASNGAHAMNVVGSAMKVKASLNASGKPSETPRSSGRSGGRSSGSSGRGGGRWAQERGSSLSPGFRGSPGERASGHCNARGMCF